MLGLGLAPISRFVVLVHSTKAYVQQLALVNVYQATQVLPVRHLIPCVRLLASMAGVRAPMSVRATVAGGAAHVTSPSLSAQLAVPMVALASPTTSAPVLSAGRVPLARHPSAVPPV